MNKNIRQFVLPLIAAMIWGSAFLVQDKLGDMLPIFAINALRGYVAVVSLLIVDLIFSKQKVKNNNPLKKCDYKKLIIGGLCCGIALFGAINIQQAGINGTNPGESAFITTLYMVLVPLFGVFLKRKIGLNVWLAVILSVIGLAFVCELQGLNVSKYYVYLLLSAIFFAVQIMFVDYFINFVDGIKLSCAQFLVASILSTIFSLIFENYEYSNIAKCTLQILYLGIMSSAVGYTLQIISQKGTNPAVVSLILSLESAFALIFHILVCLITGSAITTKPLQFFGCFLMFSAIILCQINPFNKADSKKKQKDDDLNQP